MARSYQAGGDGGNGESGTRILSRRSFARLLGAGAATAIGGVGLASTASAGPAFGSRGPTGGATGMDRLRDERRAEAISRNLTTKGTTYPLRIVFECLCAFVVRPDEVVAILPDGRNGCPPMPGGGGPMQQKAVSLPPHVAVIQFDPADLSPQSAIQPDLLFRRPGSRRDQALVFLQGEDIALHPSPSGAPTIVGGRVPGHDVPRSTAEAVDFSWVADVSKLDPAAGVIDPACAAFGSNASLTGTSHDRGRVIARMSIKGGTVSSLVLGLDANHSPILFDFTDAMTGSLKAGSAQALASAVAFDVDVPAESVALVLTPFGGAPRRLELSFSGLPMGYAIQVLIRNMPLDSLLELSNTIQHREKIYVDRHFMMYYALSKTPPAQVWIPSETAARANGPICPNARFSG